MSTTAAAPGADPHREQLPRLRAVAPRAAILHQAVARSRLQPRPGALTAAARRRSRRLVRGRRRDGDDPGRRDRSQARRPYRTTRRARPPPRYLQPRPDRRLQDHRRARAGSALTADPGRRRASAAPSSRGAADGSKSSGTPVADHRDRMATAGPGRVHPPAGGSGSKPSTSSPPADSSSDIQPAPETEDPRSDDDNSAQSVGGRVLMTAPFAVMAVMLVM